MTVGSDKLRLLRRIPLVQFDEDIRGYSKSQVDRVLETLAPLADEIEALQTQLQEATQRADAAAAHAMGTPDSGHAGPDGDFDETLRNTLLLAQRTADQTVREATAKAEELRRDSTAKADSIKAGARTEAKELKGEAHAQREQMLADAESERAQLLADALEHAESRKQAIEEELMAEQGVKRNELLSEIGELERTRDDLSADVVRFEDFLGDRRAGVRSALGEITAVLEDPHLLGEQEAPDPQDIGLLEPEDLTEVTVESYSITTLQTEVEAAQHQAEEMAVAASEAQEADSEFSFELETDDVAAPTAGYMESGDFEAESEGDEAASDDHLAADESASPDEFIPSDFESSSTDYAYVAAEESSSSEFAFESAATEDFVAPVRSQEAVSETPPSFLEESAAEVSGEFPESFDSEFDRDGAFPAEPTDPFATAGFASGPSDESFETAGSTETSEMSEGIGESEDLDVPVIASVTSDSVFSSVPETSDPAAYSDITGAEVSDPAGLGIGVESPYAEAEVAPERPVMSGLAEQARSRLASRVSRLRDSAVPQGEAESPPPPSADANVTFAAQPPAPVMEADPPPPEASSPFVSGGPLVGNEALPPPDEGQAWEQRDGRPLHPDARIEDLPPDDPFLDELRQMTGGEQPAEDETLNRFLTENPESEEGGGWFNRRR